MHKRAHSGTFEYFIARHKKAQKFFCVFVLTTVVMPKVAFFCCGPHHQKDAFNAQSAMEMIIFRSLNSIRSHFSDGCCSSCWWAILESSQTLFPYCTIDQSTDITLLRAAAKITIWLILQSHVWKMTFRWVVKAGNFAKSKVSSVQVQ